MDIELQNPNVVELALNRIQDFISNTPLVYSSTLNNAMNNRIYFKVDAMQKTGAFKIRGVLNQLFALKEKKRLPKKIVAYSTGNHGLAMAYATKLFDTQARIYLPTNVSEIKKRVAKFYGAEVIEVSTRNEAEELSLNDARAHGYYYFHPSDNDDVISGAGTMCYEALLEIKSVFKTVPDAIFASCGGGGLLAGTYLAKELASPQSKIIGVEPISANDAELSLKYQEIYRLIESPNTIADGLRALSISPRTFEYLKKIDKMMTVEESAIEYWTMWIAQLFKITCEPSSAISMAACVNWIKENNIQDQDILILISGGNIDVNMYKSLWNKKYLDIMPRL